MFTVIIPLYNKELSIKDTVQSVLNQTYKDFELVIVNDGSTDKSVKIVERIKDRRIKLLHQENKGVSAARNHGIKVAKNEWIAFLDGDDLWEPFHLEEIVRMMRQYPGEYVYVTSFDYSDGRKQRKQLKEIPIYKIKDYFHEALQEALICTNIIVVNKSCFDNIKAFNEILTHGEDLDLWSRLARHYQIVKSQTVTSTYRVNAENRSSLSDTLENTHVYHVNMLLPSNSSEYKYNKNLILDRLYVYARKCRFTSFIRLKRKFYMITYFEVFLYILKTIKERIRSKIR